MNVLVLCGGSTSERIVSLASGDAVAGWLAALGHRVWKYDPERPGIVSGAQERLAPAEIGLTAPLADSGSRFDSSRVEGLIEVLKRREIELVFPILHGGYGEDGALQSLLEWMGMPYCGSGPLACAISMNKPLARTVMTAAGIPVTRGFEISELDLHDSPRAQARIEQALGYPVVVKPQNGGSTVGLTIVHSKLELIGALLAVEEQRDGALVEAYFQGREIAATVVDGLALPLVEIRPKAGFYDYANKYTSGRTEYICPAELSPSLTGGIQKAAQEVFRAMGCRGFARVDFLAGESEFVCLELNALPGMTATSLVPKAAQAHGWSAEELIARIVHSAWSRQAVTA